MRRHELSGEEWAIIRPLPPTKARGVKRVDDRRVINGILRRFRTSAPWRDVRDCQEFRVRAGIVGKKEISHGPTESPAHP